MLQTFRSPGPTPMLRERPHSGLPAGYQKNISLHTKRAPSFHQRAFTSMKLLLGEKDRFPPDVGNRTNLLTLEDLAYRGLSLVQSAAYKTMDHFLSITLEPVTGWGYDRVACEPAENGYNSTKYGYNSRHDKQVNRKACLPLKMRLPQIF